MTAPARPRCENCDREDCPTAQCHGHPLAADRAFDDCERHRVDWRARALAVELRAERAEAIVRDLLRVPAHDESGCYCAYCGDDDPLNTHRPACVVLEARMLIAPGSGK